VLNSAKLPFIWDSPTKTDKEDAMKLAHLHRREARREIAYSAFTKRKGNGKAQGACLLQP
jgi:hypothetical protein